MLIFDLIARFVAKSYIKASRRRIRQAGSAQKEQTFYYYFS